MSPHTIAAVHVVVHHHPRHRAPPPRHCSGGGVCVVRASAATATTTSGASATAATDSPSAAFWDYNLLFRSQRAESPDPVALRVTEGAIPPDFPAGTYYLAGPGMFTDDHGSTVHPLDGHGYLRAFHFGGGGADGAAAAQYSARYVETAAKREEQGAGGTSWRFTHRGPFSVLQGGARVGNVKVMKNVANTSVLRWGGRVLCLWEGGEPYELDPRTLETLGPFDILGLGSGAGEAPARDSEAAARHRRRRPWVQEAGIDVAACLLRPVLSGVFSMPVRRLLAHYKIDHKRNRLLMVACNAEDMLLPRSNFTFYEFDAGFALVQKREFVLPDHLMIHDWAFTDNHYVLLGNRIKLDIPGSLLALTGTHPMIAALAVDPSRQSTPVYLLPRSPEAEAGGRDWSVPVEAPTQTWSMHVANAFEERDAGRGGGTSVRIHMSGCSYRWFHFHRMFGYDWHNKKLDPSFMNVAKGRELLPRLVQVSIDLDKRGACRGCSVRRLSDQWTRPADFPAINPAFANRRNRFIYAGATSGSRKFLPYFPFDSVVKLDVSDGSAQLWTAVGRKFVGEPVFVPTTGGREDDGYVLLVEYAVSDHRCHLVVLDARKIGERNAVVAKLEVPKHLTFPMGFHGFWADE
ncbi:hypothetical protein SEVIR_7G201400v4 [Setaria viridis]|uniref:Carotenoid cleavage dioxygenase 7 n=1 Tax=Setaria viridis TaxID=4556 RepID=A0A4U6TW03_SETVI|nr:carotenoid cleavage dioxygenase 7, chloroplastic isoform X1 [Setaria viridis]TKW05825.1 hypothetical protein SEVIR_7G201400v2 [Setaria viridis]